MAARQAPPGRIGRTLLRAIFDKPAARIEADRAGEPLPAGAPANPSSVPAPLFATRELPPRTSALPRRADDTHSWTDLPA